MILSLWISYFLSLRTNKLKLPMTHFTNHSQLPTCRTIKICHLLFWAEKCPFKIESEKGKCKFKIPTWRTKIRKWRLLNTTLKCFSKRLNSLMRKRLSSKPRIAWLNLTMTSLKFKSKSYHWKLKTIKSTHRRSNLLNRSMKNYLKRFKASNVIFKITLMARK